MLKEDQVAEGTLVWAHEQTSGRGQRGNTWQSEPLKNITISIVLRPLLRVDKQFYLTRVISLGVVDFLDKINSEANLKSDANEISNQNLQEFRIKWPNDIYAGNKKIAGILIENILKDDQVNVSIAGIGLNVNQMEFTDLKHATSLHKLAGKTFDLKHCIAGLCESIEARYLQLQADKLDLLKRDYTNRLYRLKEWCNYETGGRIFKAELTGVTEQGRLLLKHENGEISSYDMKEVKFI